MKDSAVITARVSIELAADIDKLATTLERSRAWIVAKAVERYVREESEFLAFVQEGEDAIDRGEFYTQEQMEQWFAARRVSQAAE